MIGPTTKIPFVDFIGFENVSPNQEGFVWVRFDRFVGLDPELRSMIMAASWMYGMPVIDFAPPEDPGLRRRLSTAITEASEDPWL